MGVRGGKCGSNKVEKVGNRCGGISTPVISDFGTVVIDVVCFHLKCLCWGDCLKVSYGRKRQPAWSR